MAKQIFILYSCDEWKSYDGMRVICATTSATKLRDVIIAEIEDENMDYLDAELSRGDMIKELKQDWKVERRSRINDHLLFGFYDYVYDGERK